VKQTKTFIKKKEDFVCQVCGTKVKGTGYTDHCPNCLFSKHVDCSPGDRKAQCQGLMEPVGVIKKRGQWQILYQCQKCGQKKVNKTAKNDNWEKISQLSQNPVSLKDAVE
jgi:predicted RNA-binding Zn-ribbon protein involved in translation (DUF1610 family)